MPRHHHTHKKKGREKGSLITWRSKTWSEGASRKPTVLPAKLASERSCTCAQENSATPHDGAGDARARAGTDLEHDGKGVQMANRRDCFCTTQCCAWLRGKAAAASGPNHSAASPARTPGRTPRGAAPARGKIQFYVKCYKECRLFPGTILCHFEFMKSGSKCDFNLLASPPAKNHRFPCLYRSLYSFVYGTHPYANTSVDHQARKPGRGLVTT